ncbi:hypothetical protein HYH03_001769 [Edaphochlamys debaryana]|uniref:SRCR domain-containing protein n=1 Tax=Edaphochlamys debaryana TaxID=47281 RepID=A0A835YEC3_9CHLO|nr:hypothetical protein HYH03_001769 [Edaphochlamys debaryana]|eukprot:KAG2500189.1 hypothetical protein HYH03_001769 [Edaphochlamys debaryana]
MRPTAILGCLVATVALLLVASVNAQKAGSKPGYQIKLALSGTGSDAVTGRVMVMPANVIYSPVDYVPMCDFDFTNAKADQICKFLGYKRGRKFYSPAVTFPSGTPPMRVAFGLSCTTAATGRRLRAGGVEAAAKRRNLQGLDQWGEYEFDGGPVSNMPYDGVVATTTGGTSNCSITVRQRCDSPFYYAGVECSDKQFKPAPPPMAVPPSPPPRPYAANTFNPTTKNSWAVVNPTLPYNMARLIQDTPAPAFQVTTTPCATLFAAYCGVYVVD